MRRCLLALTALCAASLLLTAAATAARAEAGWDALKQPGAIALMRHALAPGTGDPANFRLDDCSTQRNLDDRGRAQARAIGDAFRERGIAVDRVLTSQWCRSRETAELLGLGEVQEFPPINSFFRDRAKEGKQSDQTRAYLAGMPDDQRLVLVTHQVNITALTGRFPSSGEIFVIDVDEDGRVTFLGEVLIDP